MAEMQLKDYEHYFEQRGITLPPNQLRRYKKIIYHLDVTESYLQKRLEEDHTWWAECVSGSPKAAVLEKQRKPIEAIIKKAKSDLSNALAAGKEAERAVQIAGWLDGWLSEKGLARLRNSLNTRLYALADEDEERTVRIPILSSTRNRLYELIHHTDSGQTYDDMLNHLIVYYCQMNGIEHPPVTQQGTNKKAEH